VGENGPKGVGGEKHNLPQILKEREHRRAQRVKEANNH
jgi:hypothetical protein